jgi:hypothetical protein
LLTASNDNESLPSSEVWQIPISWIVGAHPERETEASQDLSVFSNKAVLSKNDLVQEESQRESANIG